MRRSISFEKALSFLNCSLILCNSIVEKDPSIWDNMRDSLEDENGNPIEVYQWFLTSASERDIEFWCKSFNGGAVWTYSEMLDLYVLGVTHWGSSWDYVDIDCINDDIIL